MPKTLWFLSTTTNSFNASNGWKDLGESNGSAVGCHTIAGGGLGIFGEFISERLAGPVNFNGATISATQVHGRETSLVLNASAGFRVFARIPLTANTPSFSVTTPGNEFPGALAAVACGTGVCPNTILPEDTRFIVHIAMGEVTAGGSALQSSAGRDATVNWGDGTREAFLTFSNSFDLKASSDPDAVTRRNRALSLGF